MPVLPADGQQTYPVDNAGLPAEGVFDETLNSGQGGYRRLTNRPNAFRSLGVLHRNAITTPDKLALPVAPTLTVVTKAGSTLPAAVYVVGISARVGAGPTPAGPLSVSTLITANQVINAAWAAVPNATSYPMFLSVDGAPRWVASVTEAQRAAGGFIVSSVGVLTANNAAAGSIDIGIAGTGLPTNVDPYVSNNAYLPATISPISCAGYSLAFVKWRLDVTDLRRLPLLSFLPFTSNRLTGADWHARDLQATSPLTGEGAPLSGEFPLNVYGETGLVIAVSELVGQGASVNVYVELA